MPNVSLDAIVRYTDQLLRTEHLQDYDRAANGLQVQNRGTVTRIGAAVDATLTTVALAVTARVDLLLVHHGLFWGASQPWTGKRYQLLQSLFEHDLAVYSSHLPLDAHPRLGNNARLAAALGLRRLHPFFLDHGQPIGFRAAANVRREVLAARLERATGARPIVVPGGPQRCRMVGVVTGGGGSALAEASRGGVDTFVTGEGPHWSYAVAEELGINVLYGGHYATETFGVQALATHLSKRFRLPWVFLDHPTGL
ncbi:Nif3-like dinuclear metal center hexameric protein [Myxococcota bacterium]